MSYKMNNWIFNIKKWAIVIEKDWHDWFETVECSLFKFNESFAVCSSTFWINDQWRIQSLLTLLLSFFNLLHHCFLLILVFSFQKETSACFSDVTNKWHFSNWCFWNMTWWLSVHMDHNINPALMIRNDRARLFKRHLPIRSKPLWIILFDPLGIYPKTTHH